MGKVTDLDALWSWTCQLSQLEKWNGWIHEPVFIESLLGAGHLWLCDSGGHVCKQLCHCHLDAHSQGREQTNEETMVIENGSCIWSTTNAEGYSNPEQGQGERFKLGLTTGKNEPEEKVNKHRH